MVEIPQLDIKVPELTREDAETVAAILRHMGEGWPPVFPPRFNPEKLIDLALKFEFWAECGYTEVKPER